MQPLIVMSTICTAVETFPRFDTANNDDKTRRVIFSCLLRFIQGGMAIFSSFILIVNSSNVIEIILNFTAVNFISNIDGKKYVYLCRILNYAADHIYRINCLLFF